MLAARGEFTDAEQLARQALELAEGMDFTELTADVWLALARILWVTDESAARDAAGQALALYERKGNLVGVQWARAVFEPATTITQ